LLNLTTVSKEEKEQPEQKSHFLPGAMRENLRLSLIRRSRVYAYS
jgi:hypothetical protein